MELNRSNSSTFLTEVDNSAWIRKRTKLEKGLIIFIILAVCGIIGFFVNIVRIGMEKEESCSTASCVLVASQILSQVDDSQDPCEDFFRYACGNIANVTPEEHHPATLLENKIEKQLLTLLQEPINKEDHPVVNYEKELYQACIEDANGTQAFEAMKQMFDDLKGWPVVVGANWDENNFEWIHWVPKFYKNGLNYKQILRFYLEVDSIDRTTKILIIYPPFTSTTNHDRETRKKTLIDAATIFGAKASDAQREMTEVIEFMSNVEKLKQEYVTHTDEMVSRARVSEFQQLHKEMDWLTYFNHLLEPAHTVQTDDYFTFSNMELIKALLDLVRKTSKRIIANYMFWSALNDLLPIFTDDILNLYNDESCYWTYSRKAHKDICREIIKQNFSPLSSFLAYAKKYYTPKSKLHLNDIFNRIKNEFQDLLKVSTWMSLENKKTVIQNFNTMNEIIGFKNQTLDYSVYQNLFKNKLTAKDGFFQMYLNFKLALDEITKVKLSDNDWILDFTGFTYVPQIETAYFRSKNTITLPIGALQEWYYDEDKPMYMKYATLGKNIASTLVNMMTGVRHTSDEEEIEWSNETVKGFKDKTSCIREKDIDDPMAQYYSYKKLEVGQVAGLKIAHNAYKNWVKEFGEELPPTGTHYTSAQLFWISALTDSCFKDDYGFILYMHNEPIKHNRNFAEDFECYTTTKMNPSRKCNIL